MKEAVKVGKKAWVTVGLWSVRTLGTLQRRYGEPGICGHSFIQCTVISRSELKLQEYLDPSVAPLVVMLCPFGITFI